MKENPSRPGNIKVVETTPSEALVVSAQRGRGLVTKQDDNVEDRGRFGKRKRKSGPTEEHIKRVVFENLDAFPSNEVRMLRGVFSLSTTAVREVMIPLSELVAVHVNTPMDRVKAIAESANYRFVPVFEERIDRLIGVVDVMEILYTPREYNDVSAFARPLERVPETKPAGELLEEMRGSTEPVAAVIGEHAGCTGFVTLEDILELIVGEIRYKPQAPTVPHTNCLARITGHLMHVPQLMLSMRNWVPIYLKIIMIRLAASYWLNSVVSRNEAKRSSMTISNSWLRRFSDTA